MRGGTRRLNKRRNEGEFGKNNRVAECGSMKTPGRPGKKKEGRKKPEGWPCFKSYYVGLCSGHSFPYTPTQKKQGSTA